MTTTLWILTDSMGWPRLLLLMLTALVAMVVWINFAYHVLERPDDRQKRKWVALYYSVTVLTISVAMLFAYAVLFALIFVAAWVFVPGAYFQTILKLCQSVRQDAQGEGSAVVRSLAFSDCLPMGALGSRIVHTVHRSESYPGRIP